MDRTTPVKPAARKPNPPLGSDFQPRVLATQSWNEVQEEKSDAGVSGSTGDQIVIEDEGLQAARLIQDLLQTSQKTQEQLAKNSSSHTDLEKGRPRLIEISSDLWIQHRGKFKSYKDEGGINSLFQSIHIDLREYVADSFFEMTVDELRLLSDEDLSDMLDSHYNTDKGSGYFSVLSGLAMVKTTKFDRNEIEKYASVFTRTLYKNRNFSDANKGGAHPEVINDIFMSGMQPPTIVIELARYRTKTVKDTHRALTSVLPLFQDMVNKGVYNPVAKSAEKHVTTMAQTYRSPAASSGPRPCQHCDQLGHGWKDCPSLNECLRCNTKAHKYWDQTLCLYRKKLADGWKTKGAESTKKAMAARSILDENTALKLQNAELLAAAKKVKSKPIILDSGANVSIISDITHLDTNTIPLCRRAEDASGVETADGAIMPITGNGIIVGIEGKICEDASYTLLSVNQICGERDSYVIFDSNGAIAVERGECVNEHINQIKNYVSIHTEPILTATLNHDSLYELVSTPISQDHTSTISTISSAGSCDMTNWSPSPQVIASHYAALGAYYYTADLPQYRDIVRFFHEAWDHPSEELMCRIVNDQVFDNIPKELTAKVIRKHFPQCEACPAGNMAQRDIPRTASDRVIKPGEEFQVDIKVFANSSKALKHKRAFGRYTGALTAIDLSTRFKIGKLIRSHASLEVELEALRVDVHGSGHTLRVLRLDNEFVTDAIETWAKECEPPIALQPCIPHEHHSIGDIERFNQTLGNAVFKKLYGKRHLSVQYWGMAYMDYIMKANFMGSLHGPKECPYELWTGKHPDLLKLPMIPFGAVVMAHIPIEQQTTNGPKSVKTYAVGTAVGHLGGLRLFNPLTKREVVRATYKIIGPEPQSLDRPEYEISVNGDVTLIPVSIDTILVSDDVLDYKYLIGTLHRDIDYELDLFKTVDVVEETFDEMEGPVIVAYRRRVTKTGKLLPLTEDDEYPYHIQDIVQYTAEYASEHIDTTTKAVKVKLTSLLCAINSDINSVTNSRLKSQSITDYWKGRLPRSITQVLGMPQDHPDRAGFLAATTAEIKSLRDMETWDPDEILNVEQMKTSGIGMSRCVFTKKYHPDGSFDKYKCRIVFRGDRWYDLYCNKTYAGCVMSETVRLLLSVAAAEDMEVASLDVKTAFLYGLIPITQYIYMRRPVGLTDADMPAIVRLQKCIYGLPHAPATFRNHSDTTLRSIGFVPTISDPRLYVRMLKDGTKAYVAVHVDDFGIAASTIALKEETIAAIRSVYNCVEGDLGAYLGMQLVRDRIKRTITISQPGYLDDLREQFGITSVMGPLTPMVDKEREPESESNPRLDAAGTKLYQSKVGSVLWPAIGTRPEIQFAVNIHSRYTKSPLRGDMVTLDRVLDYLVNTTELGLVLGGLGGVRLYATVDASYGTHDDRKSHSGCTLHIGEGSGAFLSRSKKQTVTADSSTVAEFIATHLVAKEIMWARSLLEEMGYTQSDPTVLGEDNMSTIAMINNDCNGQKTKHIAIRFNLIREQVQNLAIQMEHLSTTEMTSDILTKPLDPKPFVYLRTKLLGMLVRSAEGVDI